MFAHPPALPQAAMAPLAPCPLSTDTAAARRSLPGAGRDRPLPRQGERRCWQLVPGPRGAPPGCVTAPALSAARIRSHEKGPLPAVVQGEGEPEFPACHLSAAKGQDRPKWVTSSWTKCVWIPTTAFRSNFNIYLSQ